MKSRWIRQRNGFSCGPVAIMNLLKWLGESVSYETDYPFWRKRLGCESWGTPLKLFVKNLYGLEGVKITPRNCPSLGLLDDALTSGRAVVMKSAYLERGTMMGHYFLVTAITEKSLYCVNLNYRHGWVSKAAFQHHWLQYHTNYCHECGIAPYAWIIRPE
jgi:hypothetical protein